jgi:putative pyruvate formate lyase activating enzyme
MEVTPARLADIFKELEDMGAENVSLVTPSHVVEPIVRALEIYKPKIPVVFNSHGYEKIETLRLIDDYIDIYLPDLKFYSSSLSARYTGRADYFDYASEAVRFMAQKPLRMEAGKMLSGCIVRHLILPLCSRDSIKIVHWVKDNLPADTYFSLMRQYTPFGEIENFPELKRKITPREYKDVLNVVLDCGLENVFLQDPSSSDTAFIPKWDY